MNLKKILLKNLQIFLLIITVIGLVSIIATWKKGVEPGSLFCFAVSGGLYLFVRKCTVGDTFITVFGKLIKLNHVLLILGGLFFVIVGVTQFGDVGKDYSDGYVSINSGAYIDSSTDSSIGSNEKSEVNSSTETSTNSGVVDGGVNQNGDVYNLNEVGDLNGIFVLNEQKQTLTRVTSKLTGRSDIEIFDDIHLHKYNSERAAVNGSLLSLNSTPISIKRSSGEKMVLVGTEWSNRAVSRKDTMSFGYNLKFLGYGNDSLEITLNELETVCDVNVAEYVKSGKTSEKVSRINAAIKGTSFSFHTIEVPRGVGARVFSNTQNSIFKYGYFEGTKYQTTSFSMGTPFYLHDNTEWKTVPIEKTMQGYMVIDISSLPEGLLIVDSVSGDFLINIQ